MTHSAENDATRGGGPRIMQVLMHEVLRDELERWLTARGLELQRVPFLDESPGLPVYNVAPGQALWERTRILPPGERD